MIHFSRKLGIASVGIILSVLAVQSAAHAGAEATLCPDGSLPVNGQCPPVKVPESSTSPALMLMGVGCAAGLAWKRIQQVKGNKTKED